VNTQIWVGGFSDADAPLINHVADLGFDLVELSYPGPPPVGFDIDVVQARLASAGIGSALCGYLSAERDISSEDVAVRAAGIEYLTGAVEAAAALGAEVVCGPLYGELFRSRWLDEVEREREWERSVSAMREAATAAERSGVVIAVEPLNRFESDMINTAAQARRYVGAVDSPAVAIHLDTFHMNIEERDLGEAIAVAGDRLGHFHVSDSDRGTSGAGHIDWDAIAGSLLQVGYAGDIVIEAFNRDVVELAGAARIWRDFGGDSDQLAADGLKLCREAFTR